MTRTNSFLLDDPQVDTGKYLDPFDSIFDATTFRHLEALGVGPGWRCWEVGASGASVVSWLAKKVGPTGKVIATDVDTSRVAPGFRSPVEIRTHDLGVDEPPAAGLDLVHVRLVLHHVPDPERALRSMVKSLRVGGRLLVEDTDPALQPLACLDEYSTAQQLANRLRRAYHQLLSDHGDDIAYGRRLPRLLRNAGLHRVGADAFFPVTSRASVALESAMMRQIRDRLITAGLATEDDIDRHLTNIASGTMDLATAPMISAWGRRT
jgi:ubiquinone/menaquinone biosynthesis C-methylase UbiE